VFDFIQITDLATGFPEIPGLAAEIN